MADTQGREGRDGASKRPHVVILGGGFGGLAAAKALVLLTHATLPTVALKVRPPVTFGVGRAVVPPVPAASCTR